MEGDHRNIMEDLDFQESYKKLSTMAKKDSNSQPEL